MNTDRKLAFSALCTAVVLSACEATATAVEFFEDLPWLGYDDDWPVHVLAPDTVTRNARFQVEFAYYGSSTCSNLARVLVDFDSNTWTVTPIVYRPVNGSCTADVRRFVGFVPLSAEFALAGQAYVRIRGGGMGWHQPDTIVTRHVWVK